MISLLLMVICLLIGAPGFFLIVYFDENFGLISPSMQLFIIDGYYLFIITLITFFTVILPPIQLIGIEFQESSKNIDKWTPTIALVFCYGLGIPFFSGLLMYRVAECIELMPILLQQHIIIIFYLFIIIFSIIGTLLIPTLIFFTLKKVNRYK